MEQLRRQRQGVVAAAMGGSLVVCLLAVAHFASGSRSHGAGAISANAASGSSRGWSAGLSRHESLNRQQIRWNKAHWVQGRSRNGGELGTGGVTHGEQLASKVAQAASIGECDTRLLHPTAQQKSTYKYIEKED